jgi:hypothetical protein
MAVRTAQVMHSSLVISSCVCAGLGASICALAFIPEQKASAIASHNKLVMAQGWQIVPEACAQLARETALESDAKQWSALQTTTVSDQASALRGMAL